MNQQQFMMPPPPPPLPQATQLSSLSTSSTSIHAVNLPQTSSFVSNNINGSNINPRQVAAGVISKINVSPPEVAASNKSNISRGGAEVERQQQPIYGGNNGTTHKTSRGTVRFSHLLYKARRTRFQDLTSHRVAYDRLDKTLDFDTKKSA